MMSSYGLGTVLGGISSGRLCDRYGSVTLSSIGLFSMAASFILLGTLSDVYLLVLNLFVLGLSVYSFKTSNDVWMLDQCGSDDQMKMKVVNLSRVAMNLGLGVSGIIIGIFADYGFSYIFYMFGVTLFLSSIYLIIQNRNDAKRNENKQHLDNNIKPNFQILIICLFSLFCVGLMIAQLGTSYPIYLIEAFPSMGMKSVSILYLLDTFLIVFVQAPLTNALINSNRMIVMGIGAFMMGIGMFILSLSNIFALAVLSCLVWTTGEMLFMPMSELLCYENGGAKRKGRAIGTYQSVYAISAVIGPATGGYIYQHLNGNVVWYLCAILGIICLVISLYHARPYSISSQLYADAAPQEG
jgi:MFS family permease